MRPLPSLDILGGPERYGRSVSALRIVVEAVWRSWRLHWGSLRMRLMLLWRLFYGQLKAMLGRVVRVFCSDFSKLEFYLLRWSSDGNLSLVTTLSSSVEKV